MTSKVQTGAVEARRPPPRWMTGPDALPKPNVAEFRAKIAQLAKEKNTLFDKIKELRATLEPRDENDKEREELRERIKELDNKKKLENDLRKKKSDEIQKVKKVQEEQLKKLRELTTELSGFKSVEEIDEAIAYMTKKMETSGGGLAAEKRMLRQLSQLEDAKRYLQELQPVNEAIAEAKHREALLQKEFDEINERIRGLTTACNEQRSTKMEKDQLVRGKGASRQEVYAKCSELHAKITGIVEKMNTLREEHSKAMEAWNAWRAEAFAKHQAKMEEIRKERERRIHEKNNAAKLEEKRARALRRMNPYEVEIAACDTLIQYLREQKVMVKREEEERIKKEAVANFDPAKFAPSGAVILNDGKNWKDHAKGAVGGKNKQRPTSKKESGASKAVSIKHGEEKVELFTLIGEEPPKVLDDIDTLLTKITEKRKEYASHIKVGELELSSDDDEQEHPQEEEEEAEVEDAVESSKEKGEKEEEKEGEEKKDEERAE
ncbi:hypothetical protein ERJ75_000945400 [Trypanosoma vivax]|uniref:Nuclear segregation protein n=1 Tax=Trypanosoma vivax (strain Y486) TaxID=1055687 RepID=G0U4F3_TRYVY|nr:hypothetical protein ERJ75_000945400 [Trypanosoma vivax]CCC52317.1 conserved hypothetical protein [Trypanosoma vivax Y486]